MKREQHIDFLRIYFGFIHHDLELIKSHINKLEDDHANELYDDLEMETLLAIKKIRHYLQVPYDRKPEVPDVA